MKEELRTEGQIRRAERNAEICKTYNNIRKKQPLVSRNRVLVKVAKDFGLTGQAVRLILTKNNLYV